MCGHAAWQHILHLSLSLHLSWWQGFVGALHMHRWTSMSLKCPKCFSGIGMMSEHFFMKKQHLKTSCVHFILFFCMQADEKGNTSSGVCSINNASPWVRHKCCLNCVNFGNREWFPLDMPVWQVFIFPVNMMLLQKKWSCCQGSACYNLGSPVSFLVLLFPLWVIQVALPGMVQKMQEHSYQCVQYFCVS